MQINKEIALDFFKFIYERQNIFMKRQHDLLPWTKDKILSTYKFCNVYRQLDKCTIYLMKELNSGNYDIKQKLFLIILFRRFNQIGFFKMMRPALKPRFDAELAIEILDNAKDSGEKIFNDAYTICQVPFDRTYRKTEKHVQIILAMEEFYRKKRVDLLLPNNQPLYAELFFKNLKANSHAVGSFLAYQIMQDLDYLMPIPRMGDFTFVGPGAMPALARIFEVSKFDKSFSAETACRMLANKQDYFWDLLNKKTGNNWKEIRIPKFDNDENLSIHNIQSCLCEFRKYTNLSNGKGRKRYYKGGK